MEHKDMIRMANQIASFFAAYGREEAVVEISGHINSFWNPRMRDILLSYVAESGAELDPLVLESIPLVRQPKT